VPTALPLLLGSWLVINRRRTFRAAAKNATGMLRLQDDIEIEHVTDQAITVLSDTQVPRGERMILWAPAAAGGELPLRVRAVRRQAVVTSAQLRHRVRFDVDAIEWPDRERPAEGRPASNVSATERIGGIVREVPFRLLDISAGGCLIKTPVKITEGAVGWLSVNGPDAQHHEIVRVSRSDWRAEQFWPWIAGVEFLTLELPSAASLRRNLALFTKPCVEA
jgi:hypothetical protein